MRENEIAKRASDFNGRDGNERKEGDEAERN
jgi:hypothetical protein